MDKKLIHATGRNFDYSTNKLFTLKMNFLQTNQIPIENSERGLIKRRCVIWPSSLVIGMLIDRQIWFERIFNAKRKIEDMRGKNKRYEPSGKELICTTNTCVKKSFAIKELEEFFDRMVGDKETREYIMMLLASALVPKAEPFDFFVYTGNGISDRVTKNSYYGSREIGYSPIFIGSSVYQRHGNNMQA